MSATPKIAVTESMNAELSNHLGIGSVNPTSINLLPFPHPQPANSKRANLSGTSRTLFTKNR